MQEMKYVVVVNEKNVETLHIFPKCIDHDRFVEVLSYMRIGSPQHWERLYHRPISAGFTDGVKCYGSSETLNLASRPEDNALLAEGGMRKLA